MLCFSLVFFTLSWPPSFFIPRDLVCEAMETVVKLWLADYLLSSPLLLLLLSFVPVPAVCFLLPADFEMTKEKTMKMPVYCGYRLLSLFFCFCRDKTMAGTINPCLCVCCPFSPLLCVLFLFVFLRLSIFSSISPLPVFSFFSLSPAFEKMVMLTLVLWVFYCVCLCLSLFQSRVLFVSHTPVAGFFSDFSSKRPSLLELGFLSLL